MTLGAWYFEAGSAEALSASASSMQSVAATATAATANSSSTWPKATHVLCMLGQCVSK